MWTAPFACCGLCAQIRTRPEDWGPKEDRHTNSKGEEAGEVSPSLQAGMFHVHGTWIVRDDDDEINPRQMVQKDRDDEGGWMKVAIDNASPRGGVHVAIFRAKAERACVRALRS